MKRAIFFLSILAMVSACGGASDEQSKAAKEMCDCMDKAEFGDFDIDYFECEVKAKENYPGEVFSDEGWTEALEEECPTVASKMTENE